jgi:hypothetical protein
MRSLSEYTVIVGDTLSLAVLAAGCGVPNDASVTVSVSGV